MKLPNPFKATHVKCTCKTPKGEVVIVHSNALELVVPDEASEVLIEAISKGRSDSVALDSRMWCEHGIMDVQDFIKMRDLEQKKKERKERKKEDKPVSYTSRHWANNL